MYVQGLADISNRILAPSGESSCSWISLVSQRLTLEPRLDCEFHDEILRAGSPWGIYTLKTKSYTHAWWRHSFLTAEDRKPKKTTLQFSNAVCSLHSRYASAQTITMTTKSTRRCCGVFSWFRRRDINDYTYLLTYLLTIHHWHYSPLHNIICPALSGSPSAWWQLVWNLYIKTLCLHGQVPVRPRTWPRVCVGCRYRQWGASHRRR